jgi:hypothetical protein
MDACPPFRAICYGLVGTWFDVSLAPQVFKKLAGRNDQMMAVYLPYCSRFVKQETRPSTLDSSSVIRVISMVVALAHLVHACWLR